jgi:serine/threonine protein kinase
VAAPGAIRFGPFDVLSRIGIGGMGEVFRARLRSGEGEVALKLLRPEHAHESHFREMFLAECRIHALLEHPNIARLIDFGEIDQVLYMATEFVDGVGLDALLAAQALPVEIGAYIALAVLDALAYTHELPGPDGRRIELVHRDVSPSNILLSREGDVKLADFGIHKVSGLNLTLDDELKGKVSFMAPEQLPHRGPVDRRADVFSVGVLLHHMLLRRAPFTDVAVWIRDGAPMPAERPFGELLARALAVEPGQRIGSAQELAAELRRLVTPPDSAASELARLIAALIRAERPLGDIDRLIMSELVNPDSSDLVYAPDPTTDRLYVPRTMTPAPSAESDFDEIAPTSPLRTNAAAAGGAMIAPVAVPEAADEAGPIAVNPPRRWPRAMLAFGVVALTVPTIYGVLALLRAPTPEPIEPPRPVIATPPVAAPPVAAPPVTPPPPQEEAPQVVAAPPSEPAAAPSPPPVRAPVDAPADRGPRRKPAAAPPVAARAMGYLTLDTEPWATVYLGGRKLGTTPFMRVPLPAGRQQLTLDLQDSGQRVQRQVDIPSGGVKRLALRLGGS